MADNADQRKVPIGRVTLYRVRCSFPELWTKRSFQGSDGSSSKPRLKCNFLIPKDELNEPGRAKYKGRKVSFRQALNQSKLDAIAAKIGEAEARKMLTKIKPDSYALRDGDMETWDGYEGCHYVSSGNTRNVQVVGRDRTPVTEESGIIYGGCYVNAVVSFWFQKAGKTPDGKPLSNAVWATLEAVQFYDKGEAFGASAVNVEEEFEDETGNFDDPIDGDESSAEADDFGRDEDGDGLL